MTPELVDAELGRVTRKEFANYAERKTTVVGVSARGDGTPNVIVSQWHRLGGKRESERCPWRSS